LWILSKIRISRKVETLKMQSLPTTGLRCTSPPPLLVVLFICLWFSVITPLGSVTPGFKTKTRCSSYVCPGSSCHTYGQNVNIENQCLYYINIITRDIVFTQKTISTLSLSSSGTHPSHRQSTGGNASF
jgi:hypothetical protein